jgi:hypothetical protein
MGAEAGTDGKHADPVMAAPSKQRRHTMKQTVKELPILAAVKNNSLDFMREHCDPLLMSAYMTLLPFTDVLTSTSAGPQKDQNEESYIITSCDLSVGHGEIIFKIYAGRVTMCIIYQAKDGDPFSDGDEEITLEDLWEILRNCPRPPRSFVRRAQ